MGDAPAFYSKCYIAKFRLVQMEKGNMHLQTQGYRAAVGEHIAECCHQAGPACEKQYVPVAQW